MNEQFTLHMGVQLTKLPPQDPHVGTIQLYIGEVGVIYKIDVHTGLVAVRFEHGTVWLSDDCYKPF